MFESPRGPTPGGARFEGRAAVREGLAARFTGIPDVSYESHGDFVSGVRGVPSGRSGDDGRRPAPRGAWLRYVERSRGDEIVRKDSYWKIVEP